MIAPSLCETESWTVAFCFLQVTLPKSGELTCIWATLRVEKSLPPSLFSFGEGKWTEGTDTVQLVWGSDIIASAASILSQSLRGYHEGKARAWSPSPNAKSPPACPSPQGSHVSTVILTVIKGKRLQFLSTPPVTPVPAFSVDHKSREILHVRVSTLLAKRTIRKVGRRPCRVLFPLFLDPKMRWESMADFGHRT